MNKERFTRWFESVIEGEFNPSFAIFPSLNIHIAVACTCLAFLFTGTIRAEELGSGLKSGPVIGEKIEEFNTSTVSQRHLCWSCYG